MTVLTVARDGPDGVVGTRSTARRPWPAHWPLTVLRRFPALVGSVWPTSCRSRWRCRCWSSCAGSGRSGAAGLHALAALPGLAGARCVRAVRRRPRRRAGWWSVPAAGLRLPGGVVLDRDGRPALDHQPQGVRAAAQVALPAARRTCSWSPRSVACSACSSAPGVHLAVRDAAAARAAQQQPGQVDRPSRRWPTSRRPRAPRGTAQGAVPRSPTPGAATSRSTCRSSSVAWFRYGPRWQRYVAPVSCAPRVPIVYSLNRGLWPSLALGVAGLVLVQLTRPAGAVVVTVLALVIVARPASVSPLDTVFQERLAHQHSNDRRSELLSRRSAAPSRVHRWSASAPPATCRAASPRSPGRPPPTARPAVCRRWARRGICGGDLLQGLLGAALFLAFFARAAAMAWPGRTQASSVRVRAGLLLPPARRLRHPRHADVHRDGRDRAVWREQVAHRRALRRPTFEQLGGSLRRAAPVLVVVSALAAGAGVAISSSRPPSYAGRVSILLAPSPVSLASEAFQTGDMPREITVDTEAALVFSTRSLGGTVAALPPGITAGQGSALTDHGRRRSEHPGTADLGARGQQGRGRSGGAGADAAPTWPCAASTSSNAGRRP